MATEFEFEGAPRFQSPDLPRQTWDETSGASYLIVDGKEVLFDVNGVRRRNEGQLIANVVAAAANYATGQALTDRMVAASSAPGWTPAMLDRATTALRNLAQKQRLTPGELERALGYARSSVRLS